MAWIKCEERLPTVSGNYRVRHNCGYNGGVGRLYFDMQCGWKINDVVKDFYRVLDWEEKVNDDNAN